MTRALLRVLSAALLLASTANASNKNYNKNYNNNAYDDDETYYNQFSVCDDSIVLVEEMAIYCDSPGSYYYGSNKYRNSQTCQAGDKAKTRVDFVIYEDLESDPYLTLEVNGYGTVEGVSIYSSASFCESVSSSSGDECPNAGNYSLSSQFYWGSKSDSYEYSFIPKMVAGISSTANSNKFDLGGANTPNCQSGNTFANWTEGVRKSAADTFTSFMLTFGILSAVLVAIAGFGFYMMKVANKKPKAVIVDEDIDANDYHHIASLVGKEKGLVAV